MIFMRRTPAPGCRSRWALQLAATRYSCRRAPSARPREPIANGERALGYVDGIMIRNFAHQDVGGLAATPRPRHNGLTDRPHPCRASPTSTRSAALGDRGEKLPDRRRHNMANPDQRRVSPRFELALAVSRARDGGPSAPRAQKEAKITITRDPRRHRGAEVVNTDVWGDGAGGEQRSGARLPRLQSGRAMMLAPRRRDLLHCLPRIAVRRSRRRHRRSAEQGVGRGGEPPAHPEGDHGGADGR